ncbi:MAG: hypothetical protein FJ095_03460 [Deltaproteobacteria bacterium]|nr:hypothetical protein [Deltaproteobacteria bacterium]
MRAWPLTLACFLTAACAQVLGVGEYEPTAAPAGAGGAAGAGGHSGPECVTDAECAEPSEPCRMASCDAGSCVDLLVPSKFPCGEGRRCNESGACVLVDGESCDAASSCESGACVDERCCATACGVCASCAEPGFEGTCRAAASGTEEPGGACGDNRCDGLGRCATGDPKGVLTTAKSPGSDRIVSGVGTSEGAWFVGGTHGGAFGPFQGGAQDAFVARLTAKGEVKAALSLGSSGDDAVLAVAVDGKDEGYAVGFCSQGLVFPDPAATPCVGGQRNGMVFKVDLAGKVVWAKVLEATPESDSMNDVALPPGANALFVVGEAGVTGIGGSKRGRIVKLGLDGAQLWSKDFLSAQSYLTFERLTVAPDGDLIVAGILRGSALVAGTTVLAPNYDDVLVMRLSPDVDAVRWWRVFGGGSAERISGVALSPDGLVAVSGRFLYEMSVDKNIGFKGGDASEGYVIVLDGQTGDVRWAKPFIGNAELLLSRVAFDAASNLTVTGTFIGPGGGPGKLNLFGKDVDSVGAYDGFVVRTTREGAPLWRRVIGGPAQDFLLAALVDGDSVYALGSTSGGYLFGGVAVKTADNLEDGVVYAFSP